MFLFLQLFVFWVVLSQKMDALHLAEGFIAAALISFFSHKTFLKNIAHRFTPNEFLRFVFYIPWLLWQVVDANIRIASVILRPSMPIEPNIIRFNNPLPHNLARLILANSITLTPGTITIDVKGDEFVVHGLTRQALASLLPDQLKGHMQNKVEHIFEEAA